jgi:hypothetical protein
MTFINKVGHSILLVGGEAKKQVHIRDFLADETGFRLN